MLGGIIDKINLPPHMADLKLDFLEQTGYSDSELLAFNFSTRKFYTRNGGFYRLGEDGSIQHLGGPTADPSDRL